MTRIDTRAELHTRIKPPKNASDTRSDAQFLAELLNGYTGNDWADYTFDDVSEPLTAAAGLDVDQMGNGTGVICNDGSYIRYDAQQGWVGAPVAT